MYKDAVYVKNTMTGENCAINCTINGQQWSVPLDPANSDYAAIMKLVAEGKLTIAPADPVSSGDNN